jgi:ubiquinone/menaquinone biosynthesis C-methylase UbiE
MTSVSNARGTAPSARADYGRLADRYDDDRRRFAVPRDEVVDQLLASRSVVRVLDLGCGTGTWVAAQSATFNEPGVSFLGTDPFLAMLTGARSKGVARVVCARAEYVPFVDAAFDYLVSSFNFHHFSDKDRALSEAARVLAVNGGVIRINNIEPDASEDWWIYQYFPETVSMDAARFWSADRTAAALETRGFELSVERQPATEMAAPEALADAERRVISQLVLLDDDAYARGVARLQKAAERPGATLTTAATVRLTARRAA